MKKSVQIKVYGKVQGVFFRACTKEKADELNIKGTVRNCPDSSVEIYCIGEEEAVSKLIEWCHQGPSKARVDRVEVKATEEKNYGNFTVIR